jgi:hypothetical protein
MGEARVMLTGQDGTQMWMEAYRRAPDNSDLEIGLGRPSSNGPMWVTATINGMSLVLPPSVARSLADGFEAAMSRFPLDAQIASLGNLILGFRYAADQAESQP